MSDDSLASSDSVRSGKALKYTQTVTFPGPIRLEMGQLPAVTVAYETYGKLNAAGDNAVLICHAISGDSHVARHDEQDDSGWWDIAVGPGKAIDTDKLFVICPNILGGCRGTTGPGSINPATGKPWGPDFPTITVRDIVDVQRLLLEHLGVRSLQAAIGGSMGGHQVLCWTTQFPQFIRGAVVLASSPRLTSQALAFDVVGRNAIQHDANFYGGQYYENGETPGVGLALARMLGHITYLSAEAMQEKFEANRLTPRDVATEFEKKFSVGSYLAYQGEKFVERFDANSYITLTMAMDLFDLGGTPQELIRTFAASRCRWLIVSYTSDWLFPPAQSQAMVDALIASNKDVQYCNVESSCGHDAFLLPNDLPVYGELVRAFLEPTADESEADEDFDTHSPVSILRRIDYDRIVELIPPSASILDLGCGKGTLLSRLRKRGHRRLVGVELDEQAILACARRGLNVLQADLNCGLDTFSDGQFDVVVLSQTLQAVYDVENVIKAMLRVGKKCIVSFPNFAYHKIRTILAEKGRAPETSGLLRYKWYNTPNIRFFSIGDFEEFCHDKSIKIHKTLALDTEAGLEVADDKNLNADMAIFVISK